MISLSSHMTTLERRLQWFNWGCMDEFCHGFSAGKLLAACLHCVNCRLNPNHKPCTLILQTKNQWFSTCGTYIPGVHLPM